MRIKTKDFNLEATLECGQVFGFRKVSECFEGAIGGASVRLAQPNGFLEVEGKIKSQEVSDYFDLGFDLTPVYTHLAADERLLPAMKKFKGLRLIQQDPWEALACFIISSNNNVKRIMGIWSNLSKRLGEEGRFPKAAAIAHAHERTLRELGLGYRAPFLSRTAQFISTNPKYFDAIREAPYEEARARVIAFPGIGPKVADCALLYGFHKLEAFPVDVWIHRVMRKLYFNNRKVSEERIRSFAKKRWGGLAGYVQQYLFHGARLGVI